MITFLITTGVIILALGLVSYVSSKRTTHTSDEASALSLLPGDIKYEFRAVYFPITTSIVISIILSLVLYSCRS